MQPGVVVNFGARVKSKAVRQKTWRETHDGRRRRGRRAVPAGRVAATVEEPVDPELEGRPDLVDLLAEVKAVVLGRVRLAVARRRRSSRGCRNEEGEGEHTRKREGERRS